MNQKGRIALSSLAVSVSASALLGVSGAASADPPYDNCTMGTACTLGYTMDRFFEGGMEVTDIWGLPWGLEGGHYDYGWCGISDGGNGSCGCGGWTYSYDWDIVVPEGDPEDWPPFWQYNVMFRGVWAEFHDYNLNPSQCLID